MNVGALRHFVRLEDKSKANPTTYQPSSIWADIEPAPPGVFDESRITHTVRIWYHPQVSFDTVVVHQQTRRLYVKGIQNINEQSRELILLCEETDNP